MAANMTYTRRKTTELREECVCRELPSKGSRGRLIYQLASSDEKRKSPAGRKLDYQRRLEVNRRRRLYSIEPCPYFKTLPAEIRIKIWEFSLPGPRALCPGSPPEPENEKYMRRSSLAYGPFEDSPQKSQIVYDQTSLFFPKDHQPPKPAALDVCRESRYVALQQYRLCFGTPNIYADLDMDVLYFGPAYSGFLGNGGKLWGWVERQNSDYLILPAPEVVADLQRVKRVGYKYTSGWSDYDGFTIVRTPQGGGHLLRKEFIPWKGLKEVLLSHAPEDISSYDEPGYVAFTYFEGWEAEARHRVQVQSSYGDDHSFASIFDDPQEFSDDQTGYGSPATVPADEVLPRGRTHVNASEDDNSPRRLAERTICSFKTKALGGSSKGREIPSIELIVARRIPNIPAFVPARAISQY